MICYHNVMVRTQVQLTEEQLQTLRRLSSKWGVSLADLVRQSVDLFLTARQSTDRGEQIQRGLKVAGRFSSGDASGSTEHDAHLVEAFRV